MSEELSPRALEIVDQAKQLLINGGYNGFSYADVSERVRIGKASIHHHFPSKAELVQTVVARHHEQTRDGMAMLDHHFPDPRAKLEAYADYWAKCIADRTASICICALLATELPVLPPEIAERVRHHHEVLADWLARTLEQGAAKGQFQLHEGALVEAQTFMSTIHGAMLTARALGKPEVFAGIARTAIERLNTP